MSKIVLGFTQAISDLVEVAFEVYGIEHGMDKESERWDEVWDRSLHH